MSKTNETVGGAQAPPERDIVWYPVGEVPSEVPEALRTMLEHRRPAGSEGERLFIETFIDTLGAQADDYGNRWLTIPETNADGSTEPPRILWSAHTDTVHMPWDRALQEVQYSLQDGRVYAHSTSDCLGADNAAGCWLLCEMARAGVPGVYVWHRAEERGAKGSRWVALNLSAKLDGIDAAIAFDRRELGSIITHQSGGRCCSEAFASSLAAVLGMGHESDPTGSYTDTASYTDLVPECTNVSSGTYDEHSKTETLDVTYLLALRDRLVAGFKVPPVLTIERDPSVSDYDSGGFFHTDYPYGGFGTDDGSFRGSIRSRDHRSAEYEDLVDLLIEDPDTVADWLHELNITAGEIRAACRKGRKG